jgi:glycerol-3-phosphate acyltransferase PlsY
VEKNLLLGVLLTLNSLWMVIVVYTWTIIRPEIKIASDNHIMNLWEYEFWSNNDFFIILLLIVVSLMLGIFQLLKYYTRRGEC